MNALEKLVATGLVKRILPRRQWPDWPLHIEKLALSMSDPPTFDQTLALCHAMMRKGEMVPDGTTHWLSVMSSRDVEIRITLLPRQPITFYPTPTSYVCRRYLSRILGPSFLDDAHYAALFDGPQGGKPLHVMPVLACGDDFGVLCSAHSPAVAP